jgi:hypothetical protein
MSGLIDHRESILVAAAYVTPDVRSEILFTDDGSARIEDELSFSRFCLGTAREARESS